MPASATAVCAGAAGGGEFDGRLKRTLSQEGFKPAAESQYVNGRHHLALTAPAGGGDDDPTVSVWRIATRTTSGGGRSVHGSHPASAHRFFLLFLLEIPFSAATIPAVEVPHEQR